jgi:hypothetical protein
MKFTGSYCWEREVAGRPLGKDAAAECTVTPDRITVAYNDHGAARDVGTRRPDGVFHGTAPDDKGNPDRYAFRFRIYGQEPEFVLVGEWEDLNTGFRGVTQFVPRQATS